MVVKYIRTYVYGVPIRNVRDHKALATALLDQKANKTYSSMLTRRVDGLMLFDFEVIHRL